MESIDDKNQIAHTRILLYLCDRLSALGSANNAASNTQHLSRTVSVHHSAAYRTRTYTTCVTRS